MFLTHNFKVSFSLTLYVSIDPYTAERSYYEKIHNRQQQQQKQQHRSRQLYSSDNNLSCHEPMIPDDDGGVPIVRVIPDEQQRSYYDESDKYASSPPSATSGKRGRPRSQTNRKQKKYREHHDRALEAEEADSSSPRSQHPDGHRNGYSYHHQLKSRRGGEFLASYDSSPIHGEEVVLIPTSPAIVDRCASFGDVAEKVMEIDVNDPYDLCSLLTSDRPESAVDEDNDYSASSMINDRSRRRKASQGEEEDQKDDDEEDVSSSLRRNKKSFVSTMLPSKTNKRDLIGRSKMSVCKYNYKCSTCDSWFGDSVELKVHMSTHNKEKSFKSVKDFIHEKIFKKPTDNEKHPPSATTEKVVVCVPLQMEPPLHTHRPTPPFSHAHHPPPVVVMTEHLPQPPPPQRRMEIVHAPSPPPVRVLPNDNGPLSNAEKVFYNTCDLCGMQFRTYPDLSFHMAEIHNKVLPSEDGSKPSIKGKGMGQSNNPYKCSQCPASFGTSFNLKRHMRIHTGTRPYKCNECQAAFITKAQLTTHQRTHTGEKPYKCHICGGKFIQQNNLKRHIMTHTGEKPFKCDKCTAAFISSSDLKRHIRVHTGEKPYKCLHCNKGFTTSGNLSSHYKMHTGEKPYKCHLCTASFSHQSNLKTHVKRHVLPYKCSCGEGWASQEELEGHMKTCSGRWCVSTALPAASIKVEQ